MSPAVMVLRSVTSWCTMTFDEVISQANRILEKKTINILLPPEKRNRTAGFATIVGFNDWPARLKCLQL